MLGQFLFFKAEISLYDFQPRGVDIKTPNLLDLIALTHADLISKGLRFIKCIIPTLNPFFSKISFALSAENLVTDIGINIMSNFLLK